MVDLMLSILIMNHNNNNNNNKGDEWKLWKVMEMFVALIVVVVHTWILTELCILNIYSFLHVSHSSIKRLKEKKIEIPGPIKTYSDQKSEENRVWETPSLMILMHDKVWAPLILINVNWTNKQIHNFFA